MTIGQRPDRMNVRTFLAGGYRTATQPTEVLNGVDTVGVWLPESWARHIPYEQLTARDPEVAAARSVHPEPEGAPATRVDREGQAAPAAGGQSETPERGPRRLPRAGKTEKRLASVEPARGSTKPRSVQSILDDAAKAGKGSE